MWRRTYLLLVLLRLYFAFCPSYLHPDENFQGPEVIAGRIFGYPVHETWEFSSDAPIRSALPLWPIYGLPMLLLRWLWEGSGNGLVKPSTVFYTLRAIMFTLSFVLEDWAIHELIDSPPRRRIAILLATSSYVTWSWQVHTFSNALETLIVAWSLVLVKRIQAYKDTRAYLSAPIALGILLSFGTFNRATFPVYLLVPGIMLLPAFANRPSHVLLITVSAAVTAAFAIAIDTEFYTGYTTSFRDLITNPILTPLNSLKYNIQPANLAQHGTHPFYQHFLINLPQMLGPALPLLFYRPRLELPFISAMSGTVLLSFVSHQEARFLLPAVPLLLSSVSIPHSIQRPWLAVWLLFNLLLAVLMGMFHQAGVVPAQIWLEQQSDIGPAQVFWWKTYSPPTWLLDGRIGEIQTIDLMGSPLSGLISSMCKESLPGQYKERLLVAPRSATALDRFLVESGTDSKELQLRELWSTSRHVNLDDLDFGDDGVLPTLQRVVGRRGLVIWSVQCPESRTGMLRDW